MLDTIDGETPEEELEAIEKWLNIKNDQDPTFPHLIRTLEPCWCDTGALAAFRNGSNLILFLLQRQKFKVKGDA